MLAEDGGENFGHVFAFRPFAGASPLLVVAEEPKRDISGPVRGAGASRELQG